MKKLTSPLLLISSSYDVANIRYATGFSAPDPFIYLESGRCRTLLVSVLEYGRAKQVTEGVDVVTPSDLGITAEDRRSMGGWALGILRKYRLKKIRVSSFLPYGVARRLESEGIKMEIVSPVYPQRAVKTEREISNITQVQRSCVRAMKCAIAEIASSEIDHAGYLRRGGKRLTSERVRASIEQLLLSKDCVSEDTIVAGGKQASDPHERGHGALKAGETIVIDIFPHHRRHGFFGDITRTVVRGKASDEIARMYKAVFDAQRTALKLVRAGVSAKTIHTHVEKTFSRHKFKTKIGDGTAEGFIHSTGHGVGLDIHESPSIARMPHRLRKNEVITIEPGLYYPAIGGIRIEDTVAVTKEGSRMLCSCSKKLEV